MDSHTEKRSSVRKSLRQSLRDVLRCRRRRQVANTHSQESGVFREANASMTLLPLLSQLPSFPNFESSRFDIDRYSISSSNSSSFVPYHQTTDNKSESSLLPATGLSQFNLHQSYPSDPQSQLQLHNIQNQAAVDEFNVERSDQVSNLSRVSPCLRSRPSAARLRRSVELSTSVSNITQTSSTASKTTIRKSRASRNLRNDSGIDNRSQPFRPKGSASTYSSKSVISQPFLEQSNTHLFNHIPSSDASVRSIKHFGSFCVLDTNIPGCPVTAASNDLRYVLEISERFFLNVQECTGSSIDIVIGCNERGEDVTHLVLFSPLTCPRTGASRYMLASLIDVTEFVKVACEIPDQGLVSNDSLPCDVSLSPISKSEREDSLPDSFIPSPTLAGLDPLWTSPSCELLAEDLLGGCSLKGGQFSGLSFQARVAALQPMNPPPPCRQESDDIWLSIAAEEMAKLRQKLGAERGKTNAGKRNEQEPSKTSRQSSFSVTLATEEIVDDFMLELRQLYSNFFILARSPLDDQYYEICMVSRAVYAGAEHVNGDLTQTSPEVIQGLSERLGADSRFRCQVRWGPDGIEKQLYCLPMYGQKMMTWMCILIDIDMPLLW